MSTGECNMTSETVIKERETWLTHAADAIKARLAEKGHPITDRFRVACGFPSRGALAARNRIIGQCFAKSDSKGGVMELFISPTLAEVVGIEGRGVLPTLAHELCHAAHMEEANPKYRVDAKADDKDYEDCRFPTRPVGHGKAFKDAATAMGLEGKMTETNANGELRDFLQTVAEKLGPYPHDAMEPRARMKGMASTARAMLIGCKCEDVRGVRASAKVAAIVANAAWLCTRCSNPIAIIDPKLIEKEKKAKRAKSDDKPEGGSSKPTIAPIDGKIVKDGQGRSISVTPTLVTAADEADGE